MATSRSKYFNFFDIADSRATCQSCGCDFPYSSRIGTNSLRNHIRNKHSDLFEQLAAASARKRNHQQDGESETAQFVKLESTNNNDDEESISSTVSPPDKQPRRRPPSTEVSSEVLMVPTSAQNFNSLAALALDRHYARQLANCVSLPTRTEVPLSIADGFFSPALLDAMAAVRPKDPDQTARSDVEIIASNLSCVADATFYLKTTTEIVKKWPPAKVRVFLQGLLKQAMEEDNKLCFPSQSRC